MTQDIERQRGKQNLYHVRHSGIFMTAVETNNCYSPEVKYGSVMGSNVYVLHVRPVGKYTVINVKRHL